MSDGIILTDDTFNRIMNVVNLIENVSPNDINPSSRTQDDIDEKSIAYVYNSTGSTIPYGSPVQLSEPVTQSKSMAFGRFFNCEPSPDKNSIDAVTYSSIPANGEGIVWLSGACVVNNVTIQDSSHRYITMTDEGILESSDTSSVLRVVGTLSKTAAQFQPGSAEVLCILNPSQEASSKGGMVRGKAVASYLTTDPSVIAEITYSEVDDVAVGDLVSANNIIGLDGDVDSSLYVWCHGNDVFDLIAGKCPDV